MNDKLSIFHSLKILFGYRYRVLEGVMHDIRMRYVGSVFGTFWAVLFPLLQLSIYAGLYTVIFRIRPTGLNEYSYTLLVFSGLVPLMAFSETLTASTNALSSNKSLLLNTVFPAELIPLRAALAAQITSLVGLFITLILGFALFRTSYQAILLVPVFWVLLLMFGIGLGWILSLLSLVARDIQHGLSLVIMLLIFLSPCAYTSDMVPKTLKFIIYLNPMSYFVLTFQKLICYGSWPAAIPVLGSVILGVGTFLLGFRVFRGVKHVFFDYA